MEKEFIPYEQALALKELGFDPDVFKSYDTSVVNLDGQFLLDYYYNVKSINEVKAPLYQQAFRWFREKYKLYNELDAVLTGHSQGYRFWLKNSSYSSIISTKFYKSYEEAELECLKKLIEIVKNK